jgi:hypothetical protein
LKVSASAFKVLERAGAGGDVPDGAGRAIDDRDGRGERVRHDETVPGLVHLEKDGSRGVHRQPLSAEKIDGSYGDTGGSGERGGGDKHRERHRGDEDQAFHGTEPPWEA